MKFVGSSNFVGPDDRWPEDPSWFTRKLLAKKVEAEESDEPLLTPEEIFAAAENVVPSS
jgi:hypothetical protein